MYKGNSYHLMWETEIVCVFRIAVRRALKRAGFDQDATFVDTVEKMQGQECECVVVCYGVWTSEELAVNADFAYSRNRLNVATTRAKKKCIFLVSEDLLAPPASVLDSPRAKKGFFYIKELMARSSCFRL